MEIAEEKTTTTTTDIKQALGDVKKRTYQMFLGQVDDELGLANGGSDVHAAITKAKFELKYERQYKDVGKIIPPGVLVEENKRRKLLKELGVELRTTATVQQVKQKEESDQPEEEEKGEMSLTEQLSKQKAESERTSSLSMIPEKYRMSNKQQQASTSTALSLVNAMANNQTSIALRQRKVVHPQWHAPWKLMRVISGHQGWVRCLAVDPMNKFFVSGSNDRTIKFWDLIEGKLKVTLTGHINTVRGLVLSNRHPYLFSCGEDKKVLCWDLEQNKVVRHYHGHLSGIYSIALHPELDVLVTGGRDATARVWDMRTKAQVHVLGGHSGTVEDIICQSDEP